MIDRWSGALKKRSFLIRLLLTTLLAACIPLTFLSVQQINAESNHLLDSAETQLEEVTSSIAIQFDDFISSMTNTQMRLMLSPKLYESVLSSSVQSQIEALEQIKYYGVAIPFVKDFALVNTATEEVYALTGKYQISGFSSFYLNLPLDRFYQLLAEHQEKGGFAPMKDMGENLLYILPMRVGANKSVPRYAIFLITPSTLLASLKNELPNGAEIISIDCNNDPIFLHTTLNKGSEHAGSTGLVCSKTSTRGYRVTVQMDRTLLQQNMDAIRHNALLLSLLAIALCISLMGTVVFLNYRPLARLVSFIHGGESAENAPELDSIMAGYRQVVEDKGRLTWELYEKNMMIADRTMENLLIGRRVSDTDVQLLRLNMPFYRVVCAPLELVENVTDIIGRNTVGSPVYAIEMCGGGHLAFVCGQRDKSAESLRLLSETIQQLIPQPTVPLGCSAAVDAPENLFNAYLGACRALNASSESSERMRIDPGANAPLFPDEDSQEMGRLAQAIHEGDEEMLSYADRAFQRILEEASSASTKRYACYQLIDMYRRMGNSVGLRLDVEPLALLLQESSIQTIRERFLSILDQARLQRQAEINSANDRMCADLVAFLGERFTDPLFSMNEVAEHLSVSIYTASRMFKTLIGINFRKYLNDLRIEHARDLLLTTDLTVNEISEQSGFMSPSYFISVFKKTEDVTPNEFRKIADEQSRIFHNVGSEMKKDSRK